jgi:hypothetical protein
MASKAQIGFHAASDRETGKVTSVGNALVGAYSRSCAETASRSRSTVSAQIMFMQYEFK